VLLGRADLHFQTTATRRLRWRLVASGAAGELGPGPFAVTVMPDRPPTAHILAPPTDLSLAQAVPVILRLAAADDYGLTRVSLQWRGSSASGFQETPLAAACGRSFASGLTFDVRPMRLLAAQGVVLRLAAYDNCSLGAAAWFL
jgi:hypothetical protein